MYHFKKIILAASIIALIPTVSYAQLEEVLVTATKREASVNSVADEKAEISFDRERGGRVRLAYRTNQPRTVGLTVRKHF